MKEIIRMQQLAGLITEGQAKKMMAVVDKKAALKNKRSLKENESSAYITIDPKFPNEVELYADSGDYAGEIEKNGKVTFTLIFDEGDSEGTYMNSEDIFDDHAPAVFKKIVKAGGDFDAGDDYVEVTTTLDKLKKLFPMKESVKKRSMNEAEKQLPKVGDKITDEGKEFQVISVDKNFIDVKSLKDNKTYHFSSKSWVTNYPPVPAHIAEDSPKARILTKVYYIGDNAEGDLAGLAGSAVPAYDLPGYSLRQIEDEGDGMLYMKKGEIGWYDGRIFESELENSTTAVDKKYIELL